MISNDTSVKLISIQLRYVIVLLISLGSILYQPSSEEGYFIILLLPTIAVGTYNDRRFECAVPVLKFGANLNHQLPTSGLILSFFLKSWTTRW